MYGPRLPGSQRRHSVRNQVEALLHAMAGNQMTTLQLSERTGLARAVIQRRLGELREEGKVVVAGFDGGIPLYELG